MIIGCDLVREALSSQLDGEDMPIAIAAIDDHLAGCAPCRDFEANLATLNRRLRLRVFEPVPDLTEEVFASFSEPQPRHLARQGVEKRRVGDRRRSHWLRATEWVAAVVPLAVAAPALALGTFTHPHIVPSHVRTPCTITLAHRPHAIKSKPAVRLQAWRDARSMEA